MADRVLFARTPLSTLTALAFVVAFVAAPCLGSLTHTAEQLKAADLACGACRAVSRTLHGAWLKLPAARAGDRSALADLVEDVCEHLPAHAHMRHPELGDRWSIVPQIREDGSPADLTKLEYQPGLANWLRLRCEELLYEREAAIAGLLLGSDRRATTPRQLEASLCAGILTPPACSKEQLGMEFTPPLDPIVTSGAKKLDLKFVKSGEL